MRLTLRNHPLFGFPAHENTTDRAASNAAFDLQYLIRILYEGSDELGVLNHAHLRGRESPADYAEILEKMTVTC